MKIRILKRLLSGEDLAPSLGGRKNFSRTKISERRFFRKKFPFSGPKFLMTFFGIFPFFSQIFRIFAMLNVVYDPFLTRKTTISEKKSFMTTFFYSVFTFAPI